MNTTVREARIVAAARAIDREAPEILKRSAIRRIATAVVDALFTPDSLIDNAKIPTGMIDGFAVCECEACQ